MVVNQLQLNEGIGTELQYKKPEKGFRDIFLNIITGQEVKSEKTGELDAAHLQAFFMYRMEQPQNHSQQKAEETKEDDTQFASRTLKNDVALRDKTTQNSTFEKTPNGQTKVQQVPAKAESKIVNKEDAIMPKHASFLTLQEKQNFIKKSVEKLKSNFSEAAEQPKKAEQEKPLSTSKEHLKEKLQEQATANTEEKISRHRQKSESKESTGPEDKKAESNFADTLIRQSKDKEENFKENTLKNELKATLEPKEITTKDQKKESSFAKDESFKENTGKNELKETIEPKENIKKEHSEAKDQKEESSFTKKEKQETKSEAKTEFNIKFQEFDKTANSVQKANQSAALRSNQQEIIDKIVAQVSNFKTGQTSSTQWANLQMNSLEFGDLKIHVQAQDKEISIHFENNENTKIELTVEQLDQLRENLLKMEYTDVQFSFGEPKQNMRQSNKEIAAVKQRKIIKTKNVEMQEKAVKKMGYSTIEVVA